MTTLDPEAFGSIVLEVYLDGMASGIMTALVNLHPDMSDAERAATMRAAMASLTGDPIAMEQLAQHLRGRPTGDTHDDITVIRTYTNQVSRGGSTP
jgi:outer membrane biogenesis lipoprotein LolB